MLGHSPVYIVSVGLFVCLLVCLLEPLYFLWNYPNSGYMGSLIGNYVLECLNYVLGCLFVGVSVFDYVLELSEYVSVGLFVGVLGCLF